MKYFWYVCGFTLLVSCLTERPGSKNFAKTAISASSPSALHYARSVYQLTQKHCASCHGVSQPPMFAVQDVDAAHLAALRNQLIDVDNLEKSSFYTRLADDGHNCWSDCQSNAQEMLSQLKKWQPFVDKKLLVPEGIQSGELVFIDGQDLNISPPLLDNHVIDMAKRLSYDLTDYVIGLDPNSGATASLSIDILKISILDDLGAITNEYYRVQNLEFTTNQENISVKDISFLLNDSEAPTGAFKYISDVISPTSKGLSGFVDNNTAQSVGTIGEFPVDLGPDFDRIQVIFGILKVY